MAEIRAFRGIRYDLGRVGALSEVIAPPYDVIGATMQQQLYERSPYNSIRLELAQDQPGDTQQNNRYTRAAQTLRDWTSDDILIQDSARMLYAYEQEFHIEGQAYQRRGFFARVRLEPFGSGQIFPHEETMSGPKADRLRLFQATGMNLSPIFGLYPDEGNSVFAPLANLLLRTLPFEATDDLGVIHRFWPISDLDAISQVSERIGPRPIFIADGHHRYETSLRYLEEQRAAGQVLNEEAAPNFVLMMLVGMSDPGLTILPTHRLIRGLPELNADRLAELLDDHFEVETVGAGPEAAQETWELIETDGSQGLLGFGTVADRAWLTARLTKPETMAQLAPEHGPIWHDLAVSVLHVLVLDHLLKAGLALSESPTCQYVHRVDEVEAATEAKTCQLAALVPPARMGHVEQIAGNLEKMPPKSTYFYPKVATGLVFNSLKTN